MAGRNAMRSARFSRPAAALAVAAGLGAAEWLAPGRLVPPPGVAAIAILAFGFPHGALDIPLLARTASDTRGRTAVFALYIALALGVVALWFVDPRLFFLGFVGLALAHFAHDLAPADPLLRVAYAGAPILLPNLLHGPRMEALVGGLAGPQFAAQWVNVLAATALPWALGTAALLLRARAPTPADRDARRDLAAVALAYVLLDPVLALVVHFCLVHAPRGAAHALGQLPRPIARAWTPWVFGGGGGVAALGIIFATLAPAPGVLLWQGVIVALAALTLPHVVLSEWRGGERARSPALRSAPHFPLPQTRARDRAEGAR